VIPKDKIASNNVQYFYKKTFLAKVNQSTFFYKNVYLRKNKSLVIGH